MATETIDLTQFASWAEVEARLQTGASILPLLKVIRLLLIADARQAFAKERDPVTGAAWAPLAPATLKKKGRGTNPKPLRDTGVLAASVSAAGATNSIDTVTEQGLTWGSNLDRAEWHNEGTRRIPQRRFLGVGPDLEAKIERALSDWAAGQI